MYVCVRNTYDAIRSKPLSYGIDSSLGESNFQDLRSQLILFLRQRILICKGSNGALHRKRGVKLSAWSYVDFRHSLDLSRGPGKERRGGLARNLRVGSKHGRTS